MSIPGPRVLTFVVNPATPLSRPVDLVLSLTSLKEHGIYHDHYSTVFKVLQFSKPTDTAIVTWLPTDSVSVLIADAGKIADAAASAAKPDGNGLLGSIASAADKVGQVVDAVSSAADAAKPSVENIANLVNADASTDTPEPVDSSKIIAATVPTASSVLDAVKPTLDAVSKLLAETNKADGDVPALPKIDLAKPELPIPVPPIPVPTLYGYFSQDYRSGPAGTYQGAVQTAQIFPAGGLNLIALNPVSTWAISTDPISKAVKIQQFI